MTNPSIAPEQGSGPIEGLRELLTIGPRRTRQEAFANAVILGAVIYAVVGVVGIAVVTWTDFHLMGVAFFLVFASAGLGTLAGFVFAVPKIDPSATDSGVPVATAEGHVGHLVLNSNLGQVSDWLTKILLGLGLVQFGRVIDGLRQLGDYSATTFAPVIGSPSAGATFGVSAVLLAATIGFILMYMWTTARLPTVLDNRQEPTVTGGPTA